MKKHRSKFVGGATFKNLVTFTKFHATICASGCLFGRRVSFFDKHLILTTVKNVDMTGVSETL